MKNVWNTKIEYTLVDGKITNNRIYKGHLHKNVKVDLLTNADMLLVVIGVVCIVVGYFVL